MIHEGSANTPGILLVAFSFILSGNVWCLVDGVLFVASLLADGTIEMQPDVEPPTADWSEVTACDNEHVPEMKRIVAALGGDPTLIDRLDGR